MDETAGYIGRKTITFFNRILNLMAFGNRILALAFKRRKTGSAVDRWGIIEQIYFTAVQALPVIIPISLIIGSMMILIFTKLAGQYDMGKMVIILIVRELGPIVTALVVILRSATAVTIEISYMNVFNEIEAIEMAGIDPVRLLGLPRLVGITSAILCLFIVFDLVAVIGGYLVIWIITYAPMGNLLEQIGKAITLSDILVGIIKALFFGFTITVVCLYEGFNAQKQITSVPQITSSAAVECFFYILMVNIVISAIFYI